jgi:RNA polymerase sigma factor (sigma-70 family)
MTAGPIADLLQRLRRAAASRGAAEATDAELLGRFVARREEAAFEALVRRHGPMVLAVCRQLLADPYDAEDAFQATFLVLVRKAASLHRPGLLGSWLYGVAYRVAVRARARAGRRRCREREGVEMAASQPADEPCGAELRPLLYDEVNRLPEKYRTPIVLCYFQGKTNEEAARQLAWPVGTVKGRLTRARALLRVRLTRRGWALPAGLGAAVFTEGLAPAAVPAPLLGATVRAGLLAAAGQAVPAGLVSAHAFALTKGVLRTMGISKLVTVAATALGSAAAVTALGLLVWCTAAGPAPAEKPATQATDRPQPKAVGPLTAKERQQSANRLKEIALGMHYYHDTFGTLPPAAVVSKAGKPLLSWRVLILPHVGQENLFKQFKLDEPWDSAHNKKLLDKMPDVYASVGKAKDRHSTFYQVFTGPGTVFEGQKGQRLLDITDGTSNTALVVEAAKAVPWTKPADLVYDPKKPLPKLGGVFGGDFTMALADGSVQYVRKGFNEKIMRALITRNGGEVFNFDDLNPKK